MRQESLYNAGTFNWKAALKESLEKRRFSDDVPCVILDAYHRVSKMKLALCSNEIHKTSLVPSLEFAE